MHKPKNVKGRLFVFGAHHNRLVDSEIRLSSQSNTTCCANSRNGRDYITVFELVPLRTLTKKEYLEELKAGFKNIIN